MQINHDFHIHTNLSLCAARTVTAQHYIDKANELGLDKIGFSNHMWDEKIQPCLNDFYETQSIPYNLKLKEELKTLDNKGVKIYFGAEAEFHPVYGVALTEENAEKFDYIIVPNSHTHMTMDKSLYEPYQKHVDFMVEAYKKILKSPVSRYILSMAPRCVAGSCRPYDKSEKGEKSMANQVTNYKCPACTGPLRFDSATGKLQCDFCGSSYEVAEIEKLYAEKDAQAAGAFRQAEEQAAADGEWASASGSDWGADAEKLRVYSCPSCGAELICDETTSATSCPYCGNNTIVPGQFSGALKPDYVLPFKLDKAAAVAALKKHYGGKKLLPRAFSNENHIEEVKGVYVPFWLYDGSAEVDVRCHGTKVSGYSTARENVTVTNHYDVRRAGTVRFERVPVDASSKMPDDHMDAIEPFDYKELKPFSTAYLPGFLADKYDVSVQDCADRADSRCETSAVELMEQDARGDYTSCTVESQNVTLHRGKVHYALMPVWLLSTKWNGKSFLFAMNGQTGKLVGDLPLDKGLYWKHFAAITGLCMLGVMAAGLLLSL